MKAAKADSQNATPIKGLPRITPSNRTATTSSDEDVVSLNTELSDLRGLLTPGKLLHRSTLKPAGSKKAKIIAQPDPIPPNSYSNIKRIVRVVKKPKKQANTLCDTQTQTVPTIRSPELQAELCRPVVEQHSIGTQAGDLYIDSVKRWLLPVRVEPAAPTHLDHTFDFGSHRVPIARLPHMPATRTSGAYQQQQLPMHSYIPQQQIIQQPGYPSPYQNPIHYQPYPYHINPYAPVQYVPFQQNSAGPSTTQLKRRRIRNIKKISFIESAIHVRNKLLIILFTHSLNT